MYDLFSTLETLSRDSDFSATLSERGGYITFSNSGRRGSTKYFQIGLDSLLQTLRDILANLSAFSGMSDYVESDWRNNGSEYFNDPVANANSTVQTKPLFSTLSKLIIWGNQPAFDDIDSDQRIILQEDALRNTIVKLERIADSFKPAVSLESSSLISPVSNIQTIYYGCPGTGKSHTVKIIAEGENGEKIIKYEDGTNNIFRTTFHPDYDYATFVGCYKPVKEGAAIDYKFIPQVFTNAYVCAYRHREDPIYLIIEEINRGNCAQIFGDLFQLLDRTNGESDYAIKPDTELAKYLASQGVPSEELKLPDNLHIYATMNTSDQSLFPMDSAFKRRWAMEYMPINYTQKKASKFTIEVAAKKYPWIKFLEMVNERIVNATDSEDKQMGEFFIKGDVDEREFKNKVMFYLWNDVCKDLYNPRHVQGAFFLRVKNKLETEKNDYFTFAELFSDRNEGSRLLTEFFAYLESKYQEVKPEFTFEPIE